MHHHPWVVFPMRRRLRIASIACAAVFLLVGFQALQVEASLTAGVNEYDHARSSTGATATASSSSGTNTPDKAIDGISSTYWQSAATTGWIAVAFPSKVHINEVHIHFVSTMSKAPPAWSLYYDTTGDGVYDTSEKVWSETNWPSGSKDLIIGTGTKFTKGVKFQIDKAAGKSIYPQIYELNALLKYDTDGDGLTNDQEATTVYFYESSALGLPVPIPDVASNNSTVVVNRLKGLPFRGLADFTVDHGRKEDLSAVLAYWSGTAWVDVPAWDPGKWLTKPAVLYPSNGAWVNGIVQVIDQVLTYIESAIVFVLTIVDAIVQAIVQFGSWLSRVVSQAAQAVASAVETAAEALEQLVDWILDFVIAIMRPLIDPALQPLIAALWPMIGSLLAFLQADPSVSAGDLNASLTTNGMPPSSSESEEARWKLFTTIMAVASAIAVVVLLVGIIIAGLINSVPLAAVVIVVALNIIFLSLFIAPIAPEVAAGAQLAGEFLLRLGGMALDGLSILGSTVWDFILDSGETINGNIIIVDAVANFVAKFALITSFAIGARSYLHAGIGWALVMVALIIDGFVASFEDSTTSVIGGSFALGLAAAGILFSVAGLAEAGEVPYPLSLGAGIVNDMLFAFGTFGIAASLAHLFRD